MSKGADQEQNSRVVDRFTRTADVFTRIAVPPRAGDGERIAQLARTRPEDVGLDLACGPGTFTIALARRTRRVFGLDLTPAFLQLARKRASEQGLGNVRLLCADATAMPIRSGSFDVAVSGYSFHHMREPLRALRELARVLGPGGRVALADIYAPDGCDPEVGDRIERVRDESHVHTFTPAEFCRTLEMAGFGIRETESIERPRRFSDWMRVAGWEPEDPPWREARRLMEEDMSRHTSGFRPRRIPAEGTAESEIEFTQSTLFLGAIKL